MTSVGENGSVLSVKTQPQISAISAKGAPASAQLALPTALQIREIQQDNYRTRTLVLDGAVEAVPGQFVMAWLPRFDEKPFSLVNADPVSLMITAVGPFSRLVHGLEVGDRLWIRGPFGQGFGTAHAPGGHVALVAGGYGVAPLYWLAEKLLRAQEDSPRQITAILGARGMADVLYASRFGELFAEAPGQGQVVITTDDGSTGLRGRVTDALTPVLAEGGVQTVYACGPDPMLLAVDAACQTFSVPAQLSWEAYMRCGVGLCGSCEHHGRLLCLDGPVLPGGAL